MFAASLVAFDRLAYVALERTYAAFERAPAIDRKLAALENKAAFQVLVLGTSRAREALHPGPLSRGLGVKVFSEAAQGKGPRYHYEFYQLYRRVVGRPRLVVYGVDYFMFGQASDPHHLQRFGGGTQAGLAARGMPLLMAANKAANDKTIVRIVERVQERVAAASREFDPDSHVDDMEAWEGNSGSLVVPREEPASYPKYDYPRFPGLEGEYLLKLVRQLDQEGVEVVLLYPPDYVGTYRTDNQLDGFIAHLRDAVRGCRSCVVVNYSDPVRFPLSNAAYFWDGDYGNPNSHLSKAGAAEFTRTIVPELKPLLR